VAVEYGNEEYDQLIMWRLGFRRFLFQISTTTPAILAEEVKS
jgi:hypothetical protein